MIFEIVSKASQVGVEERSRWWWSAHAFLELMHRPRRVGGMAVIWWSRSMMIFFSPRMIPNPIPGIWQLCPIRCVSRSSRHTRSRLGSLFRHFLRPASVQHLPAQSCLPWFFLTAVSRWHRTATLTSERATVLLCMYVAISRSYWFPRGSMFEDSSRYLCLDGTRHLQRNEITCPLQLLIHSYQRRWHQGLRMPYPFHSIPFLSVSHTTWSERQRRERKWQKFSRH